MINITFSDVSKETYIVKYNNYDKQLRNRIQSTGRDIIIKNQKELKKFVNESFSENKPNNALHMGRLDEIIIKRIKSKITNLPNNRNLLNKMTYDLIINQSEIRHLLENKSKLTIKDVFIFVKKVPDIISNCDNVAYSKDKNGEGLRFKKLFQDGFYVSFVLISKNATLKVKSIFMEKSSYENKKRNLYSSNDVLYTPDNTSKTNESLVSSINNSITSQNNDVNTT